MTVEIHQTALFNVIEIGHINFLTIFELLSKEWTAYISVD